MSQSSQRTLDLLATRAAATNVNEVRHVTASVLIVLCRGHGMLSANTLNLALGRDDLNPAASSKFQVPSSPKVTSRLSRSFVPRMLQDLPNLVDH